MGFLLFSLANKPLTCTLIQAGDISWLRLYVEKTRRNVDLGGGGGLYYVSFTCYLSGIVMTNRDNQSLQQLLRFRIRWVGSYFFGRKRESSTNIHPIRDEFNVQTCILLTQNNDRLWNLMLQSTNLGVYVMLKGMTTSEPSQVPNHPTYIHTCWNLLKFLKPLSSDYRPKKIKTNMTFSHFCFRKF